MIELLKAVFLGAIQGIAEFLPISSTGHLILAEHLLGVSQDKFGLTFDAALHMGTLVALLWFYFRQWQELVPAGIHILKTRTIKSAQEKLVAILLLATIPGAAIGLLLEKKVETVFRSPQLVAWSLILFSFVLLYVEKIGKKTKKVEQMTWLDGLTVGFAQAIALIPGVSRSGITIAAGMWKGLTRAESARFAFLLSAPIIAGAGGVQFFKAVKLFLGHGLTSAELLFFAVGIISAAVFGYLTIKYFLRFLGHHSLYPFIFYRIILGIVILLYI